MGSAAAHHARARHQVNKAHTQSREGGVVVRMGGREVLRFPVCPHTKKGALVVVQ